MELPTWVIDEILPRRRHAATMLIIALYRFGAARFINDERRVVLAESRETLAKRAHISKRSLDAALEELIATGILIEHPATKYGHPSGLSWPMDRPVDLTLVSKQVGATPAPYKGAEPAPISRFKMGATVAPHHGGGGGEDRDHDPDPRDQVMPTTTTRARELSLELQLFGIETPESWIMRYGEDEIARALDRMADSYPPAFRFNQWNIGYLRNVADIRNPAGLLKSWLDAAARRTVYSGR